MKYLWPSVLVIALLILVYTFLLSGKDQKEEYRQSILEEREKVAEFMKNNPNSPFRKKGEVEFKGLNYFDVDPAFKVEATITRLDHPEQIMLTMSDGSLEKYFKYAIAEFELSGQPQRLVLLKSEEYWNEDWVFLPFYDETSTHESYGGGRFLEITYTGGPVATIDFNLCYNPYCAYTDTYGCPFPPPENQLTIKVMAGEKIYREAH
jgi:uncharacterized protein (DUF1684 family)